MNNNYKSMTYKQLSIEARRLIKLGWFEHFNDLRLIYSEMKLKYH